ncbi:tyrosine-type recombinase/integrase [Thalassoglobus sp.]|uniref:tyrosine-type recombinase/integrase n=1 Tax=Thalassoglobus sp. TaxID=2795869 RepID=UPI003AA9D286
MSTPKKPTKPSADFPLYAHRNGQWAKKIKGKTHFFGVWDDPDSALESYLDSRDELQAGRVPKRGEGITVLELCEKFCVAKSEMVEVGELSPRTLKCYTDTVELIVPILKPRTPVELLDPEDFQRLRIHLSKGRNPVSIGNYVRWSRSIFKYAYDMRFIERPVNFGPMFKEPSKTIKRRERQSKAKRMFSEEQILSLLKVSDSSLGAMILLAINCGFGNTDCATLPAVINAANGYLSFPRPKTAVDRLAWLWPETLSALERLDPAHKETFFRTRRGYQLVRTTPAGTNVDRIAKRFSQSMKALGISQPGLNFYALRHTFETVASNANDQQAVDLVMGHVDNSMAGVYREEIDPKRVKAVCEHVRNWLFGLSNLDRTKHSKDSLKIYSPVKHHGKEQKTG